MELRVEMENGVNELASYLMDTGGSISNPNVEFRNPKQIRITKYQMTKTFGLRRQLLFF